MQLLDDFSDPNWDEFSQQCNLRFGPPIRSNKLGELAKLRQTGTVADYQNKFEALVSRASTLTQHQKIQLYLSGLQDSIAVEVELQHPKDLVNAMSMSRLYERKLFPRSSPVKDTRRHTFTSDFRLCFNCYEQFVRGHQCKKLFWIDLEESDEAGDTPSDHDPDQPEISLNTITGIRGPQSMRLYGNWKGGQVLILIDSGSTHSFVSATKVEDLQAEVNEKNGLKVNVANGEQLTSPGICKGIPILLESISFMVDLFVLPLTDFDVVLGVNWLRTLGPILWDFTIMKLQGMTSSCSTSQSALNSLLGSSDSNIQLQKLLAEFAPLFDAPTGLPPSRACDHRIPLEPGAKPVVVRPYRYPHGQKDEIEKQCAAMLKQGIIRPSRSPFSSPVILVPKADGSWRLCVDYRELNAKTIKDKFPIPVIDKLLEELGGANFFTKLDLLSGYFQVGMHPADVGKTAFRTHHVHFEFLVMPFDLSNAPSTFQALMNEVFQPFLRKFVLVFFDDILVFNQSWAEHLHHLRLNGFSWTDESVAAFEKLKSAMTSTPILVLPNLN
ncbi:hypothetical protein K2173_020627 [Erythroxylum novogranatense]|uniref:Reverse transcriptase domain-containing protein n=1 Tax=Erythroxylum novogranatense TaxID=1862640 RepID=A0AAV8TI82_9ROSI|nr:hypothetical protein K2173_020627 [Erythroxylum novogranatense]